MADSESVIKIESEVVYAGAEGALVRIVVDGSEEATYFALTPEDMDEEDLIG